MKEKFGKLLLGEDMSNGAKGVCITKMAISNLKNELQGKLNYLNNVFLMLCDLFMFRQ
jgi:hypothetical protein